MTQPSFWEEETFLQPYDLIIVGAGIVGLSSALFYKQEHPSARVAVLERGVFPKGASTRNAGFACIGSIGEHLADLQKTSEENIKARIVRRYRGLELLKQTLGEEAINYDPCGGYELFTSDSKFKIVASKIDRFNRWMEELLDEKEVYTSQKLEGYPVIYNRLEGALHPGKMMQALVQKALHAGIEIRWNTRVQAIDKEGSLVGTNSSKFSTRKVLLATNGFTRRLLPKLEVTPARGYVLVTNAQEQMPWQGTFHHDRGYIYFRNIGDQLLIGGARNMAQKEEETDVFGVNASIKNHLIDFTSKVLGLPDGWTIEEEWSGIMGFTPTKAPVVQQLAEHSYVAAGLSGMGIAIGMEVGQQAANLLQD
ncbi:NAD(P)/FAD-dependent oxidoreductase [Fodinibius salsisoli]|uniref:FAD-dependent oxidoreductase n=1 Tax=Fodinibius salsisoli TaxID=2820877 RepID=A0ABT3PP35_9BACT|nr:FAD-dependent oxidoreductase [Fodinibius salsisoli]MCW9707601.1 FAD-dependent oxidoreductase [Fodinibius salsisoli]